MKKKRLPLSLLLPALLLLPAHVASGTDEAPSTLPDFTGKELVEVKRVFPEQGERVVLGWRGKDADGADRIWFADGWSVPTPKEVKPVDLAPETERFLHHVRHEWDHPQPTKEEWARSIWGFMGPATRAAWLRHCGHDGLADAVLAEQWPTLDPMDILDYGPLRAVQLACRAFRSGNDAAAIFHARGMREHFQAAFAPTGMQRLLDDLERREKEGRLGVGIASKTPPEYTAWPTEKKVAWLTGQMDLCVGGNGNSTWLYEELNKYDESAIPFFLAAARNDKRLTRSTWYNGGETSPLVICPSETRDLHICALQRLMGMPFTLMRVAPWPADKRGHEMPDDAVAEAQKYWDTHKDMPKDDRFLKALMDEHPELDPDTRAWLFEGALDRGAKTPATLHPMAAKFPDDRLARFVLGLHDQLLAKAVEDDGKHFGTEDAFFHNIIQRSPGRIVSTLDDLVSLGDRRILPELKSRAHAAPTVFLRAHLARACAALGELGPAKELAADLAKDKLDLDYGTRFGYPEHLTHVPGAELFAILENLDAWVDEIPDLESVARLDHPRHAMLMDALVEPNDSVRLHFGIPGIAMRALAAELESVEETGIAWKRGMDADGNPQDWITGRTPGGKSEHQMRLPDPKNELDLSLPDRRCDRAAIVLSPFLLGVPQYGAFSPARDGQVAQLRSFMARFGRRLRVATDTECQVLGVADRFPCMFSSRCLPGMHYLPSVGPLGHPATAKDVEDGLAIFHLKGDAKLGNLRLPQAGRVKSVVEAWKGEAPNMLRSVRPANYPRAGCLVVQAEQDADGQLWFGIVTHDGMRQVKAEEVSDLMVMPPTEAQFLDVLHIGYGIEFPKH